jgi:hypothetical protein
MTRVTAALAQVGMMIVCAILGIWFAGWIDRLDKREKVAKTRPGARRD